MGTLWYVNSDSMGSDEKIGQRLMQMYLNSIGERMSEPGTYAFVNRGVLLTLDDSPVLRSLQAMESAGCRFLACGTCLDYYGVRERLAVGEVGSMPLLEELMLSSTKVITL